jgi:glycine oxidase
MGGASVIRRITLVLVVENNMEGVRKDPMPDLLVIGGGAIGLAGAWRAARAGAAVAVVDEEPGGGASGVAAGMLAPVTEAHYGEEGLLRLNLRASERYPSWIDELQEETELDTGYRRTGTVVVARDNDDNSALGDLFAFQQELGLSVQRLRSEECRRAEPALAPSVRGGILVEGDHQIDPRALVDALKVACELAGVDLIRQRAGEVLHDTSAVRGIRLQDGSEILSNKVVIAAGAWSGALGGLPDGLVPVRPVKGQLLHLRAVTEPLPVQRNIRGLEVYIVPRADGRAVIGATMEERGFDTTITTGALYEMLRRAYELVPGITEMEFVEAQAGLRPGTPDNAPLIGPTDIEGLFAATGHFRNGILLAPVTADAIVGWAARGDVGADVAPFSPDRFRGRKAMAR